MTDDKSAPAKGSSQFEKAGAKNTSLLGELWGYLGQNKKWWLLPMAVVFFFFGAVVFLSTVAPAAAPFIYTFF
jgi:hypothetical protein